MDTVRCKICGEEIPPEKCVFEGRLLCPECAWDEMVENRSGSAYLGLSDD